MYWLPSDVTRVLVIRIRFNLKLRLAYHVSHHSTCSGFHNWYCYLFVVCWHKFYFMWLFDSCFILLLVTPWTFLNLNLGCSFLELLCVILYILISYYPFVVVLQQKSYVLLPYVRMLCSPYFIYECHTLQLTLFYEILWCKRFYPNQWRVRSLALYGVTMWKWVLKPVKSPSPTTSVSIDILLQPHNDSTIVKSLWTNEF